VLVSSQVAMEKKKLPKNLKKHVRIKKAQIRKHFAGKDEQKKEIEKMYKALLE